jgi:hypothetical protein
MHVAGKFFCCAANYRKSGSAKGREERAFPAESPKLIGWRAGLTKYPAH